MFRGSVKHIGQGDVSTLLPACGVVCKSGAKKQTIKLSSVTETFVLPKHTSL